jgi:hypothetical protein
MSALVFKLVSAADRLRGILLRHACAFRAARFGGERSRAENSLDVRGPGTIVCATV